MKTRELDPEDSAPLMGCRPPLDVQGLLRILLGACFCLEGRGRGAGSTVQDPPGARRSYPHSPWEPQVNKLASG